MPRVLIQTDDGDTVQIIEYPLESIYALQRMPGCPSHTGLHNFLNRLSRGLEDAGELQEHGAVSRRLSERVMERMEAQTYKIVRHYSDQAKQVTQTGLTFKDARDHCASPAAHGDCWNDIFETEE